MQSDFDLILSARTLKIGLYQNMIDKQVALDLIR